MIRLTKEEKARIDELLKDCHLIPIKTNAHKFLAWARMLESGKYRQCKNMLRSSSRNYCCLGVLCEHYRNTVGGKWIKFDGACFQFAVPVSGFRQYSEMYYADDVDLPGQVLDWLGEEASAFILQGALSEISYADLNDNLNLNFRQIAYLIRMAVRAGKGK